MRQDLAQQGSPAAQQREMVDDLSHDYLRLIKPDEHHNVLTVDLIRKCSQGFSKPVIFRNMLPVTSYLNSREFLEVALDQKLLWREKSGHEAVAFRSRDGKTDYNYISGREGTGAQYLDEIFVHKKDVYAHLGHISSGFKELHKYPWGATLFDHIKQEIFKTDWCQIPEWELSGHLFLGNNTQSFAEPSCGAPGSDWHMFPTTNIFILIAGRKKWMSYPPQPGDQHHNYEEVIFPSGGREGPLEEREFDTVYLEPGDVLFNVPYEWHKVLNQQGWSLGVAFRVIDRGYVDRVLASPANKANIKTRSLSEEYAHMATSIRMASHDPIRMQMTLNTIEMFLCAAGRLPFLK